MSVGHIDFRYILPMGTTTEQPILQYRVWGEWPKGASEWIKVPTVGVSRAEFERAKSECTNQKG